MEEKEIDIRVYFSILKKRFKLIMGITIAAFLCALIISLNLPKVYESAAIIEKPKVPSGKVDAADVLNMLFKNPVYPYLQEITDRLGKKGDAAYYFGNSFSITDKDDYLIVKSQGADPADTKKIVEVVSQTIVERYKLITDEATEMAEKDINVLKERIKEINNEIEKINKKLASKEKTDILAQSQVYQSLYVARDNAVKKMQEMEDVMFQKKMSLEYLLKPGEIVAEPSLPIKPLEQNKKVIVLLSTLTGLFISILLVFIIEFFQKEKK